jgi:hypothetical protein
MDQPSNFSVGSPRAPHVRKRHIKKSGSRRRGRPALMSSSFCFMSM